MSDERLLTDEEIKHCYFGDNPFGEIPAWTIRVLQNVAKAQLAKAEPLIRADERSRLAAMVPEEALLKPKEVSEALVFEDDITREICNQCIEHLLKAQLAKVWPIAEARIEQERAQVGELANISIKQLEKKIKEISATLETVNKECEFRIQAEREKVLKEVDRKIQDLLLISDVDSLIRMYKERGNIMGRWADDIGRLNKKVQELEGIISDIEKALKSDKMPGEAK